MNKSNLIDIEVVIHHETKPNEPDEGAVLVSLDGDSNKAKWVPKSAAEIERKERRRAILTMPEALAIEKGLV